MLRLISAFWYPARCDAGHQRTLDGAGKTPQEAQARNGYAPHMPSMECRVVLDFTSQKEACSVDPTCGGLYDQGCNNGLLDEMLLVTSRNPSSQSQRRS